MYTISSEMIHPPFLHTTWRQKWVRHLLKYSISFVHSLLTVLRVTLTIMTTAMRMTASLNVYYGAPVLILTPKELALSVVTGDDCMCMCLRTHSTTKLNQIPVITKICQDLEAISYKAFIQDKSTKLWVKERGGHSPKGGVYSGAYCAMLCLYSNSL